MLSPKTWPKFSGDKKDGCVEIMNHINVPRFAYELGLTKMFIKSPQTVKKHFHFDGFFLKKRTLLISISCLQLKNCG